jgi:HD superfamily phosphodiesterase
VDTKRINHAEKVLDFAEMLLEHEPADRNIVIPASILHDVGIKVAEEKYGSAAGHYQEKEGPEIARNILLKTGLDKKEIDEICQIIGHHHSPGKINTHNFMVLYDADWLVNLKDEVGVANKDKLKRLISKIFLTRTGKLMAEKLYL